MVSILFAGGGTGGHVCPAVAVAQALERLSPGSRVLFLGTGRAVEKRILDKAKMPHTALPSVPATSLRNLPRALWAQARGLAKAYVTAREFRPDVVLGLGGYASAAGVLAGRALGARVALFEPNATPGRATQFLARAASEVYVHWEEGGRGLRAPALLTGTPLNEQARAPRTLAKQAARAALGLSPDKSCLLVIGGSQGARGLNRWVLGSLATRAPGSTTSVVHVSGGEDEAALRAAYARAGVEARVAAFLDDVGTAYRAADLAVCRSGAATLAELAAEGLPALLVPLPTSALDHQRANARAFQVRGGGRFLEESELTAHTFEQALATAGDAPLLLEMSATLAEQARPDAADEVARRLLALAGSDVRQEASRADRDSGTKIALGVRVSDAAGAKARAA